MVLDSEEQRSNLLEVIDNVVLASGTLSQQKAQISAMDKLRESVSSASVCPDPAAHSPIGQA